MFPPTNFFGILFANMYLCSWVGNWLNYSKYKIHIGFDDNFFGFMKF